MNYLPELRKYKRIQARLPVEMRRVCETGRLSPNRLTSRTADLGAGGIMCEIERCLKEGTTIRFRLKLERNLEPLEIIGEIVWSQQVNGNGTYRIGIEFMNIDKHKRNFIVQYVYTNGNGH